MRLVFRYAFYPSLASSFMVPLFFLVCLYSVLLSMILTDCLPKRLENTQSVSQEPQ